MPASPESADIRLSVCYALPDAVFLREIAVAAGTTILDAIQLSGLTTAHPEVDPTTARVGIYGKLKTLDTIVREGDRVEVYRALTADPKTARRKRVQKVRQSGVREGQKWLRRRDGTGGQGA
ncbi:MAG: RnfH family protein [Cupriavidus sp.]|uniref:RnfH family protein n=1 Tax=Cupriavidus pauculus TaxID=82633 RepID=UPI000784C5A2|nr:RnfH family protein [Cupriavidus pauculus]KAB0605323.1 RnfH family protein [Cupriavidus pauculus]MBU66807.1 RnfH family protein [Cupriavidus sp.]MCM3605234.1 RnfH family protein [Cupriavidus pauculus]UAK99687.1 RnfH family protein [Cupriavidus pauculus]